MLMRKADHLHQQFWRKADHLIQPHLIWNPQMPGEAHLARQIVGRCQHHQGWIEWSKGCLKLFKNHHPGSTSEDEMHYFALSLVPILNQLNRKGKKEAKIRILNLLDEIESSSCTLAEVPASHPPPPRHWQQYHFQPVSSTSSVSYPSASIGPMTRLLLDPNESDWDIQEYGKVSNFV